MTFLSATGNPYPQWRDQLAARGLVVVGVEFRNAGGALGPHPFPAGLNDCYSALEWCNQNKAELNISGIIISGESGGGNLCLTTAMKAKKEGKMDMVQGVYSQCPSTLGPKKYRERSTVSLVENSGYFIDVDMLPVMIEAYGENSENPDILAWPSFATVEDLKGLPPHCISVNELDPLRDEGLDHARKLVRAGESPSRTVYQAGSQCTIYKSVFYVLDPHLQCLTCFLTCCCRVLRFDLRSSIPHRSCWHTSYYALGSYT